MKRMVAKENTFLSDETIAKYFQCEEIPEHISEALAGNIAGRIFSIAHGNWTDIAFKKAITNILIETLAQPNELVMELAKKNENQRKLLEHAQRENEDLKRTINGQRVIAGFHPMIEKLNEEIRNCQVSIKKLDLENDELRKKYYDMRFEKDIFKGQAEHNRNDAFEFTVNPPYDGQKIICLHENTEESGVCVYDKGGHMSPIWKWWIPYPYNAVHPEAPTLAGKCRKLAEDLRQSNWLFSTRENVKRLLKEAADALDKKDE